MNSNMRKRNGRSAKNKGNGGSSKLLVFTTLFLLLSLVIVGGTLWWKLSRPKPVPVVPVVHEKEVEQPPIPTPEPVPEPVEPEPEPEPPPAPEPEQVSHDHLSAKLLSPSSRRIVLQAGALNGRPDAVFAPLEVAEFGVRDCADDTVTVEEGKTSEKFPQRLRPGQRVVWHVGDLAEVKEYVFRTVAVLPERTADVENPAALCVLFNGKTVYYRMLEGRKALVQAVLPCAWSESMGDTVVIENIGKYQVAFDAVWIEELAPLQERLTLGLNTAEKIPKALRKALSGFPETDRKLYDVSSHYGLCDGPRNSFMQGIEQLDKKLATEYGLNFNYRPALVRGRRTYSVLRFLSGAVGFFHHGGTHLRISNILSPGGFASPLSGKLNPEGYALWTLGQVLPRPDSSRLHINVTPPDECEYPLPPLFWIGALHSNGSASIMVVRNVSSVAPHAVQITASLPWSGPTRVAVRHGGCPQSALDELGLADDETLAAEMKTNRVDLDGGDGRGMFRQVFEFHDVLFVRLNRPGVSFPEPVPYSSENKNDRGRAKIS